MRSFQGLTIQDIAVRAGVSTATVSRVLHGNARVSQDKITRVREVIEELGYRANPFAKSLLSEPLKTVGVLIPNLHDEFYGVIVNAIEQRLYAHGLHMMCTLGHDNQDKELDALRTFQSLHLDAYILFADLLSDETILELTEQGVPIVLLNRLIPEIPQVCLSIDNEQGGFIATQHLISLGHTRIAHITGALNRADTLGRYTGYVKALESAGLKVDPKLFLSVTGTEWAESEGRSMTQRLLSRTQFTALFAANDWLALGAMQAIEAAGLGIPGDVSVVSFDNRTLTRTVRPPLTCIDYPRERLGTLAAERVIELLAGRSPFGDSVLTLDLMIRQSTRTLPPPAQAAAPGPRPDGTDDVVTE